MFYIRFRKHTRLNDCFIIPDKFGAAMALVKSDIGGNITVRILLLCVIMLHVVTLRGYLTSIQIYKRKYDQLTC